jgi:hypothetical protein
MQVALCGMRPVIQLGCSVRRRGKAGAALECVGSARPADNQRQPYHSHTVAPDRGKPGSGVIETVRGRLSVNQRSWRHVSGTRLDDALGALLPSRGSLGRGIDWRGEGRAIQAGWGWRGRLAEHQLDLT